MVTVDFDIFGKVVQAGAAFIPFAKAAKEKELHFDAVQIVAEMATKAISLSYEYEEKVKALKTDLIKGGAPLGDPLPVFVGTPKFWMRQQEKVLRNARIDVDKIEKQLSAFTDDLVAIARCKKAYTVIADSFQEAEEYKKRIRKDFAPDLPLGKVLDNMLEHAGKFRAEIIGLRERESPLPSNVYSIVRAPEVKEDKITAKHAQRVTAARSRKKSANKAAKEKPVKKAAKKKVAKSAKKK